MSVIDTQPTVAPIEVAEPNEAQRILLAARDLIADESRWCRGTFEQGGQVCAFGAIWRTLGWSWPLDDDSDEYDLLAATDPGRALVNAGHELHDSFGEAHVADVLNVNDEMGHQATMRMFNRAIELAGQR